MRQIAVKYKWMHCNMLSMLKFFKRHKSKNNTLTKEEQEKVKMVMDLKDIFPAPMAEPLLKHTLRDEED
jgi:hypothetical protein